MKKNTMLHIVGNTQKPIIVSHMTASCLAIIFVSFSSAGFAAMDNDTATAFLKNNDCTKCHSVKKTKKGPSYKKIAAKYKDKPDAMDTLFKQVTTGPTVKLEDGSEEEHKILKDDPAEIRELLQWILNL